MVYRCCCQRCPRAWAGCTLVVGVVSLLVGIWLTSLNNRLTPVYQDITCSFGSAKLENLKIGIPLISPTTFGVQIEMKCFNPNPYTISFDYSKPGEVYLGDDKTIVGNSMVTPYSSSGLPAGSNGSVFATTNVTITGTMLLSVLPQLMLSTGVPVYIELRQKLGVDLRFFFGGEFKVQQDFTKDCGMMISGLAGVIENGKAEQGALACADSWADLEVPSLSSSQSSGSMSFAGGNMDSKTIEEATNAKDLAMGISMGVTYGAASILLLTSCCLLWSICRTGRDSRELKVDTALEEESKVSV